MRWVLLLLGLAFMLGLGMAVGQRLTTEAMTVVVGVVAGVFASIPTSLVVTGLSVRMLRTDNPVQAEADLPEPPAPVTRTQRPVARAVFDRAVREHAAVERAALEQVMREHAYEQASAQMDPRSDPRIVVVTHPPAYTAAGYLAPQAPYAPPAVAMPYPPRRFTVIGGAETANDEHLVP